MSHSVCSSASASCDGAYLRMCLSLASTISRSAASVGPGLTTASVSTTNLGRLTHELLSFTDVNRRVLVCPSLIVRGSTGPPLAPVEWGCDNRPEARAAQRSTRAPPPPASLSTSALVAMVVSPGVVIASAPCAAPYSTAVCSGSPSSRP